MNHLIIDGHALAYRSHFAFATLRTANGLFSGCLYGFLTTLGSTKKKFKDFKITVAWDNEATRKKAVFSSYKCDRTKFGIGDQVRDVKSVLSCLALTQAECPKEEADDVIATLVENYKKEGKVYILTNDKDLTQLVEDGRVIMLCPARNGMEYYDSEAVKKKFGVSPQDIACFLALRGDDIDSIPGLPRVRSTVIASLVEKYRSPQEVYRHLSEEKLTDNERLAFTNFEQQSAVNLSLTNLVRDLSLVISEGTTDPAHMQEYLNRYEIKKISAEAYVKLFGNESSFHMRESPVVLQMTSLFD